MSALAIASGFAQAVRLIPLVGLSIAHSLLKRKNTRLGSGQLGHLTKGKTGHLSNPKIVQLGLAPGINSCYTAGSKPWDEMTRSSQVARPRIARIGDSLKSREGSCL
jgi:hypothetical protein